MLAAFTPSPDQKSFLFPQLFMLFIFFSIFESFYLSDCFCF